MTSFKYHVINSETNRKVGKTTFTEYEKARQYMRKLIRKTTAKGSPMHGTWRSFTSNPAMFDGSFIIRKIKS